MPEVVILRAGYSRPERPETDGSVTLAGCSISLVIGEGWRMLVDPGGPADRDLLLAALLRHGLAAPDIAYVVCTHGHIDHVGNANLFPGATFVSGRDRSVGDRFWPLDVAHGPVTLADGIEIVASPGHTSEDISVVVHTWTGVIAIAGDVFENGDPADTSWRAYSRHPRQQQRSQAALLARADFIVPGHGPLFATTPYRLL